MFHSQTEYWPTQEYVPHLVTERVDLYDGRAVSDTLAAAAAVIFRYLMARIDHDAMQGAIGSTSTRRARRIGSSRTSWMLGC
jgi:hypothetical protein